MTQDSDSCSFALPYRYRRKKMIRIRIIRPIGMYINPSSFQCGTWNTMGQAHISQQVEAHAQLETR